jgi:hypothetical protein
LGGVSLRSDSSSKLSVSGSDSFSASFLVRFLGTVDFGLGPGLALGCVVFFAAAGLVVEAVFFTALALAF